jgi:hypothetical protein
MGDDHRNARQTPEDGRPEIGPEHMGVDHIDSLGAEQRQQPAKRPKVEPPAALERDVPHTLSHALAGFRFFVTGTFVQPDPDQGSGSWAICGSIERHDQPSLTRFPSCPIPPASDSEDRARIPPVRRRTPAHRLRGGCRPDIRTGHPDGPRGLAVQLAV